MHKKLIIGSRGSDLALWQAKFLQNELMQIGFTSEIQIIKTQGDQIQHISLEKLEGKGFFTKEIEDALLGNKIGIAVHSHKDLPTEITPGLIIAGVSYRESPAELLLIRKEAVDSTKEFQLKENAIIGTSSSRRMVQLNFFRPDLVMKDIRGNVPTRIDKLRKGDYDAILLASAGVNRLQLNCSDLMQIILPENVFVPAPAQGVLAYQCRNNDPEIISILNQINHADVAETIFVEREVMRLFQGGCHMPLGVFCKKENDLFHIWAAQASDKSTELKRLYINAAGLSNAAGKIFNSLSKKINKSVFITTTADEDALFVKLLKAKGCRVQTKSLIKIERVVIEDIPVKDWLFFTSKNGVNYFFDQVTDIRPSKLAAVGEETASELRKRGHYVDFIGEGDYELIATEFLKMAGQETVLFPQAQTSADKLFNLIGNKTSVAKLIVYKNEKSDEFEIDDPDIIVFTSSMNADAYLHKKQILPHQQIIAIGNSTKEHLELKGIKNVLTPPFKNLLSVADLICGLY